MGFITTSNVQLVLDLDKDDYMTLSDFLSYIKYGDDQYLVWTSYKNKVYVLYTIVEERFFGNNERIVSNYISKKEFVKRFDIILRKDKIKKIKNEMVR